MRSMVGSIARGATKRILHDGFERVVGKDK